MRAPIRLVALLLAVAGCASPAPAAGRPSAAVPPTTGGAAPSGAAAQAGSTPSVVSASFAPNLAAFLVAPLTDVRTGERFTLSDFIGKVTIVQGMAVW